MKFPSLSALKSWVTLTQAFEVWLAIAVFYFLLSFGLSLAVRKLEKRLSESD